MKNKKILLAAVATGALVLTAVTLNNNSSIFANKTTASAETYYILLNKDNFAASSSYSALVTTSAGNSFEILYTGTHSVSGNYLTLEEGAYISNYNFPIDHLTDVEVTMNSGSLKLEGGQTKTFYESYTFTESGSYHFVDDMNYFKLYATSDSEIESIKLTYTDACKTGEQADTTSIKLEGTKSSTIVGESFNVSVTTNSKGTVELKSSDESVIAGSITSSKSGKVYKYTALKAGTAKIWAQTSNGLKSSEYSVTVLESGLPTNVVGKTFIADSNESDTCYIEVTAKDTVEITIGDAEIFELTYCSTDEDQYRYFLNEDDGISWLDIKPTSDGKTLNVNGTIYDESCTELVTFGNEYNNEDTAFSYYVPVTSITLDQEEVTFEVGETIRLTATIAPSNATHKEFEWSSDDTDVVTVSDYNLSYQDITAKGEGETIITVTELNSGNVAYCYVTVTSKTEVSSVTISGDNTVVEGKTIELTASVTPSSCASRGITWKSSDTKVATVKGNNGKCTVTAVAAGPVTITATCDGVSGTYNITVTVATIDTTYDLPEDMVGTWYDEYSGELTIDEDGVFSGYYLYDVEINVTYTGHKGSTQQNKDTYRFANEDESLVLDLQLWTSDELDVYIVSDDNSLFSDYFDSGDYFSLNN